MNCTATIKTPVGSLTLTENNGFITECRFTQVTLRERNLSAVLSAALDQFEEYFSGRRTDFDLPIAAAGTPFQKQVWAALRTIPYGEKWSYQELARVVGNPGAARAVGSANAQNPICIIVPCHRVIQASGKPGKYAGGEDVKVTLLDLERQGASIAVA